MKKIISMLLVCAIMVTFMIPAMANGSASSEETTKATVTTDNALKNAIQFVKTKISIPEDCKTFNYNVYTQNGINVWYLSWSNEKTQKYISVTIDEKNFISSYSSYQYTPYNNGKKLPKYSRAEAQKLAEKFVSNLDSSLVKQFKLVENIDYYSDREYYFTYVRQVNGISFFNNMMSIAVNSTTGEISSYNCSYSKTTSFEDASKVIGLEKAKAAFAEKLGLKLVYQIKTVNDKLVTYLAYIPKEPYKYIDAITGNVENINNNYEIYDTSVAYSEKQMLARAAGESVVLTPEEIDAVDSLNNIITKENADKKIRAITLFNLDGTFTLQSAELRKDWSNENSFIWTLQYRKVLDAETNQYRDVSVSLNAKTGDVQNFWTYYTAPEGTKPQKTKEEAKAIADSGLKELLPSKYLKLKYDESYNTYYEDKTQTNFTFRYVRVENGLECPSDYVTISFDNLAGKITSMYGNWTEGLTFADPKKAISVEQANQVLFEKIGYDIQYVADYTQTESEKIIAPYQTDITKAVLGYFFDNYKPKIIDATTGAILNYNGIPYKENRIADYTDIAGSVAENKVKILTQLNIKYLESELKANDLLLQKDYFLILSRLNDLYYMDESIEPEQAIERMYNELINQGIITSGEKAPNATLTREEAAKYFIKFLKLGSVAEIKDIFKCNFTDVKEINPNLIGYVSLASGLKAMNGSNGKFMPKKNITRLEGLMTIYNYLNAR